jgi:LysM repeat protein
MADMKISSKDAYSTIKKFEADAARQATKEGVDYKDDKKVIEKDSLKVAPGLEKKTSEELNKLYETHNTDGQDGLTETEFDALFKSVVGEDANSTEATIEKDGETKTVTVKPGDNLYKIARENGISLDELKAANPHLFQDGKDDAGKKRSSGGNLIYPGDQIVIPQKPAAEESTKTEESEKTEETKKTEETEKTEESEKTEETEKTEESKEATPEEAATKAKETIDGAKIQEISPADLERLTGEELQAIMDQDTKTVDDAKAALEQIPADDPQRAEYEEKVKALESDYKSAYGISDAIKVDESIDDNEARRMVSDRKPEELDKLDIGTRLGLIKALDKGATSYAEYQAIGDVAKSIARTNPEALTPDVVKQMGDDGIQQFMKELPAEQLDKLPAETRGAMIQRLAKGETTPQEDKLIGELANSLAKTNPEALTADIVASMDDNGVRELMDHLDADGLNKLPADTRKAMIQQLVDGATSDEEDKLIGRIAASIAQTDPAALTPELIHSMDDNGVRAMTKDMSVEDLSKLPRAVLEAMREELRSGWTTDNEYKQIDKITQALPNAK